MKKCLFYFLIIFCFVNLQASTKDSLVKVINSNAPDSSKINACISYYDLLKNDNPKATIHYLLIAYNLSKKNSNVEGMVRAMSKMGIIYDKLGDIQKSILFHEKAMALAKENKLNSMQTMVTFQLAQIYMETGKFDKVLPLLETAEKIEEKIENSKDLPKVLMLKARYYTQTGKFEDALKNAIRGEKYSEKTGDSSIISSTYNNIGLVYYQLKDFKNSALYLSKSVRIDSLRNDEQGLAKSLKNLASIYARDGDYNKSLEISKKCLFIVQKINDEQAIGQAYGNMASNYTRLKRGDLSIPLHKKEIAVFIKIQDSVSLCLAYHNLGASLLELGRPKEAIPHLLSAINIGEKLQLSTSVVDSYGALSEAYFKSGDGINAYIMHEKYGNLKDSLYNVENEQNLMELKTQYETEKKEQEIVLLNKDNKIKNIEIKNQNSFKNLLLTLMFLSIILLFVFVYAFIIKRKANKIISEQKLEVENKNIEIHNQKEIVEEKNKEILDSIIYAKRLQEAILPPVKLVKEYLKDSFILYKPKDIVAGDFYFMEPVLGGVIFAAADCTGHGVPGAMVSVVCSNAMNRAVKEFSLTDPGKILDKVRELVIETFQKSETDVKDGMDISLCFLNTETLCLQWSGANNPLWILNPENKDNTIIEIKADKMPIGNYAEQKPFTTHQIQLKKGETIYIFTDGFADQFGGPKGKKLKYKPFSEKLISISAFPMEEQRVLINDMFEDWKGNLEQVDDVCILGIKM